MSLLKQVIESNKKFFRNSFGNTKSSGVLLYESFYKEEQLISGISKVALCIAHIKGLKPVCMLPISANTEKTGFIKSINPNTLNTKKGLLTSLIFNFPLCIKTLLTVNSKDEFLALTVHGIQIGPSIYDTLLRKNALHEINGLSLKLKLRLLLELLHFCFFYSVISRLNVKMIVLGDNTYRYGLLFAICKKKNIPCIGSINLNRLVLSKFVNKEDFNKPSLCIPADIVEKLINNPAVTDSINQYVNKRIKGDIEQHDVIKAYKNKEFTQRTEFFRKYNLDLTKPVVVVMAHVFCDAPHALKNNLYRDYYEWFIHTVVNLKKNKNVNMLVKEHPSASFYGEEGKVKQFLEELSFAECLVDKNESTKSILENGDIVLTCGGTIGLEFSVKGKPVVLASLPNYSRLGFTVENAGREEYEHLLRDTIQHVKPLTEEQRQRALCTAYVSFELFGCYSPELEIGTEKVLLGRTYNNELLYQRILDTNQVPLEKQKIYETIREILESEHHITINQKKLRTILHEVVDSNRTV